MKFSRWMYSQINMYMKLKLIKQEKRFFGTWCIECIRKYRYEPTYEFLLDRNGNIVLNEAGDPIYKKDLKEV